MTTTQVQVRIPKKLASDIDKWIEEGRFVSRSEAIKTIVTLYNEKERTRRFYEMLSRRSRESKEDLDDLVALEEASSA